MQAVALALACLSYDFVGTSMDDSSEDLGTIQVSTTLGASLVGVSIAGAPWLATNHHQ